MSRDRQYSVYVGRLSTRSTRNELQEEFERFGTIKDIDLRRSHAFIEFSTSEEARAAVEGMDNVKIHGERIVCQRKGERQGNSKGPQTQDICYNCGRKGHWANECKEGCNMKDTCYRCMKRGHTRRECPLSRTPSRSGKRKSNHHKRKSNRKRSSSSSSSRSSSDSSRSRSKHRKPIPKPTRRRKSPSSSLSSSRHNNNNNNNNKDKRSPSSSASASRSKSNSKSN